MFYLKLSRISSEQLFDLEKPFAPNNTKNLVPDQPNSSYDRPAIRTIKKLLLRILLAVSLFFLSFSCLSHLFDFTGFTFRNGTKHGTVIDFYHSITRPSFPCAMNNGSPNSYAGTIGLRDDSDESPKRLFFWLFEADNAPADVPIILTIGGGPGTSGLVNGLNGQSRCLITASHALEHNPNDWTEHFNLLILDHPVNAGYSYGTRVNNSHDAAVDVHDFLQKFFQLFPNFRKNKLVLSGGSYGGVYVPNIGSVIHENNKKPGNILPINLYAIMLSNPITDPLIYHEWVLEYRCNMHQVYNSTTCEMMFSNLPKCLEAIQLAYQFPNPHYRTSAEEICFRYFNATRTETVMEDVRRNCTATMEDPTRCHPFMVWTDCFFKDESTKKILGLSKNREYNVLNMKVNADFWLYGDQIQHHQEHLIPLMNDGVRVLFYIGAQDANCPWPGVLSSIKQLQGPHQEAFLSAPDIPWDSGLNQTVTVRQVGEYAGDLTYMLIDQAGHFVTHDQPKLTKMIVKNWIDNVPFVNASNLN